MNVGAARREAEGGASPMLRAAAVTEIALGLGFGVGAVVTLIALARNGELPLTPWGFRSMAGGPFEALGRGAFTALGAALIGVCGLQVLAGAWMWQGRRRGAQLTLVTTPPALGLGVGFALPFLLIGAPIGAVLALIGLRRRQ